MSVLNRLTEELQKKIKLPAKKIVCAVSGGADSMVLLMRCALHRESVVAAHVNYGRRGAESDADEILVSEYCRSNDIPLFVYHATEEELTGNFQQSARVLRYRFFEKVRFATQSDYIATAHHADDVQESLVMQLFRSGNLRNMRGIKARDGHIIRPMLHLRKADVLQYAQSVGLKWREDASNQSPDYTRNRLRHEILPVLDKLFPGWSDRLQKTAAANKHVAEIIAELASAYSEKNQIKISALNCISDNLCEAVLDAWMLREAGFSPPQSVLSALRNHLKLQKGSQLHIGNGFEVVREEKTLLLRLIPGENPEHAPEYIHAMPVAGEEIVCKSDASLLYTAGAWQGEPQADVLELRAASLRFPLVIRPWKAGDRMQPLGMKGTKLISDILTDHKVMHAQRISAKVLVSFDGVLLAVIFPRNEYLKTGLIAAHAACRLQGDKTLIFKRIS